MHACDGCGGEFLASDEREVIDAVQRKRYGRLISVLHADNEPQDGEPVGSPRGHFCPGCGEPMTVVGFGGRSGIVADRCESCGGTWIECDELQRTLVVCNRWSADAAGALRSVIDDLERDRADAAARSGSPRAWRFAFVQALLTHLLAA